MNDQLQFEKICQVLELGELIGSPESVSGGFLHRMYRMKTDQGTFAVKALNPEIMQRPTARHNFIRSEQISRIAATRVPSLPAIQKDNSSLHEIDNQCYLVFPWVDGKSLPPKDIHSTHCYTVAQLLADIHSLNSDGFELDNETSGHSGREIDWDSYVREGRRRNTIWAEQLNQVSGKLEEWTTRASLAANKQQSVQVLSHGDLDSKNVLWSDDQPLIIDWESAGFRNSQQDLVETALYWAVDELGHLDEHKFKSFLRGYKERRSLDHTTDWAVVLDFSVMGKLDWLEYNLKRCLDNGTSEQDRALGTAQVIPTLEDIERYETNAVIISRILDERNS